MEIIRSSPVELFLIYDNGKQLHFNITKLVSINHTEEMKSNGSMVKTLEIILQHNGINFYEDEKLEDEN